MPYATPITCEHFLARTKVDETTGCWIWQLSKDRHGYGLLAPGAQQRLAHRLSFHLFRGEIPGDLTVDHLCFTTDCVNPSHLRLLSASENSRNRRPGWTHGPGGAGGGSPRTHCRNGHEFTPENSAPNGKAGRICRTCRNSRLKRATA